MKHLYSLPVIFASAHFRLLATPRTIYAESTVEKKKRISNITLVNICPSD